MYSDYDEACEAEINHNQAKNEVESHGLDFADFLADCGDKEIYQGREVLDWLGY